MSNGNGANDFGVSFGRIMFLQQVLSTHSNVTVLGRHDDIVFDIRRNRQGDVLSVVCVEAYSASLELVMRVVQTFPEVAVIFVGGKWNGYTREAYEFCEEHKIGIYNAGEIAGGLHSDSFWNYEKLDDEGNLARSIKA